MLSFDIREVPIRLSVPVRKCDGCGGINESAVYVLRRTADGGYTPDPELPKGWNTLAVGSHSLDLCDRCSAAAVLERRQAKPAETVVAPAATASVASGGPLPTILDAVLGPEAPPAIVAEAQAQAAPNGGTHGKNKKPTAAKEAT